MAIHPGEGCEGRRLSGKEGASVIEEEKVAASVGVYRGWLAGLRRNGPRAVVVVAVEHFLSLLFIPPHYFVSR